MCAWLTSLWFHYCHADEINGEDTTEHNRGQVSRIYQELHEDCVSQKELSKLADRGTRIGQCHPGYVREKAAITWKWTAPCLVTSIYCRLRRLSRWQAGRSDLVRSRRSKLEEVATEIRPWEECRIGGQHAKTGSQLIAIRPKLALIIDIVPLVPTEDALWTL